PARLVQADEDLRVDLHAVAQWRLQGSGPALKHHAVNLRAAVLQREIKVPGRGAVEVRELAPHPEQRETSLEGVANAAQQLGDGKNGPRKFIQHDVRRGGPSLH